MRALREFLRDFWRIARPYWYGEDRWVGCGLLALLVAISLATVLVEVLFNTWNNDFYNTLENRDFAAFKWQLLKFCLLAAAFIVLGVYQLYFNQMLQMRWRRWMTQHYLGAWLGDRAYYAIQTFGGQTDNPDQRISDDLRLFVDLSLGLTLGLLSAVVTLASFLGILWGLSGSLGFTVFGSAIAIPGYMVWFALIYAFAGTWLAHRVGHPLIRLNFDQQRREADFRFGLVRVREYAEPIALSAGEADERRRLGNRFERVVNNWWRIMRRQKRLTWWTSGYNQIAVVFPFIVASPRYFANELQLGGLMQTASAFGQVQSSLSFIVNSYASIATWKSVIDRLKGFEAGVAAARELMEAQSGIRVAEGPSGGAIALDGVDVTLPDGAPLLAGIDAVLRAGDRVLLSGPSGAGKSTLFRVIAGIWPFGSGAVRRAPGQRVMFLPQKPYLPLGSLRGALAYPATGPRPDDDAISKALEDVGLPELAARLDEKRQWSQELSPGEQQRVGFARVLLQRPDILFLDEATAALDDPTEARLYALINARLLDTLIVSIGHRPTLGAFHTRRLEVRRAGDGPGRVVERQLAA
jgi:putative ATP-binding cassette transporter